MVLRIRDGMLLAVYDDKLVALLRHFPDAVVIPAGRVAPDNAHSFGGNWLIEWNREIGGPIDFVDGKGRPFVTRQAALDYEAECVSAYVLCRGAPT